jgi:hypothetical protein
MGEKDGRSGEIEREGGELRELWVRNSDWGKYLLYYCSFTLS